MSVADVGATLRRAHPELEGLTDITLRHQFADAERWEGWPWIHADGTIHWIGNQPSQLGAGGSDGGVEAADSQVEEQED